MVFLINNEKDKLYAHENNLLHKSSHLLVVDSNYVPLCRLRKDTEERYAGLYTTTFGTHVFGNDTHEQTILKGYTVNKDSMIHIGTFLVNDGIENETNELSIASIGHNPDADLTDRFFINLDYVPKEKMTPHLFESYKLLKTYVKGL